MDELAAKRVEQERDAVVTLLRAIADRLGVLVGMEAREPLRRLAAPVEALADEAAPVLGPLPPVRQASPDERSDWRTVVFVQRGAGAGA